MDANGSVKVHSKVPAATPVSFSFNWLEGTFTANDCDSRTIVRPDASVELCGAFEQHRGPRPDKPQDFPRLFVMSPDGTGWEFHRNSDVQAYLDREKGRMRIVSEGSQNGSSATFYTVSGSESNAVPDGPGGLGGGLVSYRQLVQLLALPGPLRASLAGDYANFLDREAKNAAPAGAPRDRPTGTATSPPAGSGGTGAAVLGSDRAATEREIRRRFQV
ncbi:hypothetical protein HK405_004293 [Cladochytrium tenue]|nr:hypothetical protein HK405_004293 [Cladochytrium tenue]